MKLEDIQHLIEIHNTAKTRGELQQRLNDAFPNTQYSTFVKIGIGFESSVIKPCEYCHTDYPMNLKNRGQYCSRACLGKATSKRQTVHCLNCDVSFSKKLDQIKQHPQNFCSRSCAATYHNKQRALNGYSTKGKTKPAQCSQCSKSFDKSIHSSSDLCGECSEYNHEMYRNYYDASREHISKPSASDPHKPKEPKPPRPPKEWAPKPNTKCQICDQDTGKQEAKFCDDCRSKQQSLNRIAAIKEGKTNFASIKCDYIFNGKPIHCDSKLEYSGLNYFETHYQVIDIDRASVAIPYTFEGKERLYLPDFQITTIDTIFIVECKSDIIGDTLNERWRQYKETAAVKKRVLFEWCAANGYTAFWYEKRLNSKFYNALTLP